MAVSYDLHRKQIIDILTAWSMPRNSAEKTADIMAWADLHGIDSHGISMLTVYDVRRREGRLNMAAEARITYEGPTHAHIDGDGGLGHVPSRLAMETAIKKAGEIGIAVVTVKNSAHFGACGYYAGMAAQANLIGIVTTSASTPQVAPSGGQEPRLGTDPLAFGAPGEKNEPFILDMATTTVAAGKIRNKENEGLPCPPGWVVTAQGQPSTDPLEARQKGGFLTSLGGSPEGGDYKGYGLGAMVNILSSCLSGATLITDPLHTKKPQGMDIGHFFLAIDPTLFRPIEDFRHDVGSFCASLRSAKPIDPSRPVMIAGDPERAKAAERSQDGIPIAPKLLGKLETIAKASGAQWFLN